MAVSSTLKKAAGRLFKQQVGMETAVITPHQTVIMPQLIPQFQTSYQFPESDVIDINPQPITQSTLADYLFIGRQYHALCRHHFVEQVMHGHYAYSRYVEYRTCAIAAAYAGAFGSESIKSRKLSKSMAIWRLNQRVGYDLTSRMIVGPTGRTNTVADEMFKLIDVDYWTREGVADWLQVVGL
ncbi:MAG: hypothetical protein GY943_17920 [Chloroflexi bacterium]|nr:hypothetical protein [Chloroflexota bacterium]